jgi:hypothetical protein
MTRDTAETLGPLVTGAVSAAAMQGWTGWWLNSGAGVALVGTSNTRSPWARPVALWVGCMTGLTASLFWVGPGTIWPIVLLVSSVLTAGTIMVGIGVGRVRAYLLDGRLHVRGRDGTHVRSEP